MRRILIAGGPRVGKTTLAAGMRSVLGIVPRSTDDLIGRFPWSDASAEVARWLEEPGPWVVEGVAVPRALRKWLEANAEGLPADALWFSTRPKVDRTPGQITMAKGVASVWAEVEPELRRRGLVIHEF